MKKFLEYNENINEAGLMPNASDPPMMLLMRRKAIRIFPNGQRIALYHNDKLNLDISIPYFSHAVANQPTSISFAREDVEKPDYKLELVLNETVVKKLNAIARSSEAGVIKFANGTAAQIQPSVAAKLVDLYKKIGFQNRVKYSRAISSNPSTLKTFVDFTRTLG